MAYDEVPRKPLKGSVSRRAGHDENIDRACMAGKDGVPTDASAVYPGYLGVDDIDRIRRKNLKHRTQILKNGD